MLTYDALIQKPFKLNGSPPSRPKPLTFFLPPKDLNVKKFAKVLQRVGKEMEKGAKNGNGCQIADSLEECSNLVFGPPEPKANECK